MRAVERGGGLISILLRASLEGMSFLRFVGIERLVSVGVSLRRLICKA
jgi:hypothetical protein